jgi:hypothetical protein
MPGFSSSAILHGYISHEAIATILTPITLTQGPDKRQVDEFFPEETCGYLSGDPTRPRTADIGWDCRFDLANSLWGFCPQTVIDPRDCGLAGYCVDQHECSDGCGRLVDWADITTVTWYASPSNFQKWEIILLTIFLFAIVSRRTNSALPPSWTSVQTKHMSTLHAAQQQQFKSCCPTQLRQGLPQRPKLVLLYPYETPPRHHCRSQQVRPLPPLFSPPKLPLLKQRTIKTLSSRISVR